MKLIDSSALIADIVFDTDENDTAIIDGKEYLSYDKLFNYIVRARTVAAVEVVRCKDCKHYNAIVDSILSEVEE